MVSNSDLEAVPLFLKLSDAERKIITSVTSKQEYLKDDIIINENSPGGTLFVVKEGEVKITRLARVNNVQNLATVKSGEFFGGISLIDNEKYSASAVCVTDCMIFQISNTDFNELANKHPLLGIKILNYICIENCLQLRTINTKILGMVEYIGQR